VTDYVIRAETTATALKGVGEIISDGLLSAMVMKGLPKEFKSFVVVTTQNEKVMTYQNFKVALRNYEENECLEDYEDNNKIMNVNVGRKLKVNCCTCGLEGHKSVDCRRNEKRRNENDAGRHIRNDLWCGNCRSTSYAERFCRRNRHRNADSTTLSG